VIEVESESPEETERVAARLAEYLTPGDIVTVSGELGAGKTTFVRGACRALGVTGPVTSPTFTIGHRYHGRVSSAEWGELEPYFADAVVFVEWPEAAGDELGAIRARVVLRHVSRERRMIGLDAAEKSLLDGISRC
jgi:tRNA threonylcarbamoyladenosine biosynthesis protein TsaE